MSKFYLRYCFLLVLEMALLAVTPMKVWGQEITLEEAISEAKAKSVAAVEARSEFLSSYWQYRSYLASLKPSVGIYGNIMSFDRSLTLLQDYNTGQIHYARTYNLQNSIGLSVSQNVAATGGTLSVYSDLSRIDQFGAVKGATWYSQPFTISYTQPLFSFNQFKWSRRISPKEYELAKKKYLEAMEDIALEVVTCYFGLLSAQKELEVARGNYEMTKALRSIAFERMKLGRITKDELLKLDLNILKDSVRINEAQTDIRQAQMRFNSMLAKDETFSVKVEETADLPLLDIDYDEVLALTANNSSFGLNNEIAVLNADSEVARAKASRGISMSFMARLGLSKTDKTLARVYSSPLDQEVVGLSFSIPVFDWGVGYGRVQKAKAKRDVVMAKIEQEENNHRRSIYLSVSQFNNQRGQCLVSAKTAELARERYVLVSDRFRQGKATVTDLIDAQTEKDTAELKHISDMCNYWTYYYRLRKSTLYDFIKQSDIIVDFEQIQNR